MNSHERIDIPVDAASLDDYEEAVIFSEWRRLRHHSSRSLARTGQLMAVLGYDPAEVAHRTLGVVGSKGKGTAAAYASAALAGCGHRVGTVMSPGVMSNADRIRIDGETVDDPTRRRALQRIQRAAQQLPAATSETGYLAPTGLFIVMAMLIFAEAQVEVVVAEAGIGGASDDLSHWSLDGAAVTGIFAEHLNLLGPTVTDVAQDKAAVITPATQFCVSYSQDPVPWAVLRGRCAATGTELVTAGERSYSLLGTLPAGFPRDNAAVGVSAGLRLAAITGAAGSAESHGLDPQKSRSVWPSEAGNPAEYKQDREAAPQLGRVLDSVNYPGRMSVHPAPGGRRCVVDSAVSGEGLAAALEFAGTHLQTVDQVLVCLPQDKDLAGFRSQLHGFTGRKVFVEMPGAYIGMPDRQDWPWEWVSEDQLPHLLAEGNSLAVGTVLYSSLVLQTLGVDAQHLFAVKA